MGGCLGEWAAAAAAGRWWRINNEDGDEDENDQSFFSLVSSAACFLPFFCFSTSSRCQPVRGTEGRGMSLGNAVTAAAAE